MMTLERVRDWHRKRARSRGSSEAHQAEGTKQARMANAIGTQLAKLRELERQLLTMHDPVMRGYGLAIKRILDGEPTEFTPLSNFIRNAGDGEKQAVYAAVIARACEKQQSAESVGTYRHDGLTYCTSCNQEIRP